MSTTTLDPAERLADELGREVDLQISGEEARTMSSAVAEQAATPLLPKEERATTRLLIVTTDASVTDPNSARYAQMREWAAIFAELHIVVVNVRSQVTIQSTRPAANIWIYGTNSRHSLRLRSDAQQMVHEQLEFAGGFRADMIIALDPFISGYTAVKISASYHVPLQVHLEQDVWRSSFIKQQSHRWRQRRLLARTFAAAPSVRVTHAALAETVRTKVPTLADQVAVLPRYVDLEKLRDCQAVSSGQLQQRYPQHSLFVLYCGSLGSDGRAVAALQSARLLLQHPAVALVLIGERDDSNELAEAIKAQQLEEKVIINPPGITKEAALCESQIYLHLTGDQYAHEALLEAAAARVAIIAEDSDFIHNLFSHDESALVCPAGDVRCVQRELRRLFNDNALRRRLSREASDAVFDSIEQDRGAYLQHLRLVIEEPLHEATSEASDEVIERQGEKHTASTTA